MTLHELSHRHTVDRESAKRVLAFHRGVAIRVLQLVYVNPNDTLALFLPKTLSVSLYKENRPWRG